jgi:hypothetical protein
MKKIDCCATCIQHTLILSTYREPKISKSNILVQRGGERERERDVHKNAIAYNLPGIR